MDVWVGTSGFAYPDWVGDFYPPRTPAGRMLGHYARPFPLVELNFTYYRLPTAEQLDRLAAQVPPGFRFVAKLHQSLTHEGDPRDGPLFRAAVAGLRRDGRLLALLAQFPQRLHYGRPGLDLLARLADLFAEYPLAVEFRHRSWHRPEATAWLAERGLHLVSVDVPPIPALFPAGLVQSSRLLYVRFHSHRADAWYAGDKERYDYDYSDDELRAWLAALAARRDQADRALLLFNNCHRAQAARNARRVLELLRDMGEVFEVVEPPAAADDQPRQGTLFGP